MNELYSHLVSLHNSLSGYHRLSRTSTYDMLNTIYMRMPAYESSMDSDVYDQVNDELSCILGKIEDGVGKADVRAHLVDVLMIIENYGWSLN